MAVPRPRDEIAEVLRACAVLLRRWSEALGRRVARVAGRIGIPVLQGFVRLPPRGRVLFAVGITLFLFGWASMPAWMAVKWLRGSGMTGTEFPLGEVHDVAVDSRGRIFVAVGYHQRVQRYSPAGEFERGWPVPTSGVFALRTTADDRVRVATARANKLLTYDGDGELLDSLERLTEDHYSDFVAETETTGPYAVRRGLFPHVIDTRTGEAVISTPWPKRLIATPFLTWMYALAGLALAALGDWKRRRERATNPAVTTDPFLVAVRS